MELKPILIVGALNSEINDLINLIEEKVEKKLGAFKVYEGKINNYPVVLLKTEVGLINASSAVTLTIEKYNPLFILNEGTAGGITKDHHKKDIVIVEKCININSYKSPYKELGEGSDSRDWEFMSFTDGGKDEKKVFESDERLVKIIYSCKESYKEGNVFKGIVGSGDAWNREKDKLNYLYEVHDVACEDMEAFAIYTIAEYYNIPAVSIKIMSDNELLKEEYEPKVATYCQEFVQNVIVKLIENVDKF